MQVVFRTDASNVIGSGHVMRCLALAEDLKCNGADIVFICREHRDNMCALIESYGHKVYRLPAPEQDLVSADGGGHSHWLGVPLSKDAEETTATISQLSKPIDWLVVDHYSIDSRWESILRPAVRRIMVVDDLADRPHTCDVLLDQNLYSEMQLRYDPFLPNQCIRLLGPDFAMLRKEFLNAREMLKPRSGTIRNILVSFGGSDTLRTTIIALKMIAGSRVPDIHVDVAVGPQFTFLDELDAICAKHSHWELHINTSQLAQLMAKSDLAFGGGGITTWERCCLGLPCILIAQAFNQIAIAKAVHAANVGIYIGEAALVDLKYGQNKLRELFDNPGLVSEMSRHGMKLVDGRGTQRISSILNSIH